MFILWLYDTLSLPVRCETNNEQVVVTDGGDEFTDSAMEALRKNLEKNACNMVGGPPIFDEGKRTAAAAAANLAAPLAEDGGWEGGRGGGGHGAGEGGAEVCLERLTWGEHEAFLGRYGGIDGGVGGGFDFIVAADVICELYCCFRGVRGGGQQVKYVWTRWRGVLVEPGI